MNGMYKTIEFLCSTKKMKVGALCSELGISRGIMGDLKAGRTKKLSVENTIKVANYFGVTAEYLVNLENMPWEMQGMELDALKKERSPATKGEGAADPDIRRIERARKNMSAADKQKMMKILEASFEDYFSDDYVDDDLNE